MTTNEQQALIERLTEVLGADERVQAACLSGSLGRGAGDAFSDVDVIVAVEEEDLAHCVAEYGGARNPVGPTVWLKTLYGRIVSAVTPRWDRYDLQFMTLPEFRGVSPETTRSLLRRSGVPAPTGPRGTPVASGDLRGRIEEFIRILGLAPVAVGREEWLAGQEGVFLMRKALIDLMIEDAGGQKGGAKRLNPFLKPEHRAALEAIDPPRADRESLLAAQVAVARLYLPLARAVAAREGVAWPEAFEAATRAHLKAALDLDV